MTSLGAKAAAGACKQLRDGPSYRYAKLEDYVAALGYRLSNEEAFRELFADQQQLHVISHAMGRSRYSRFLAHECDALVFLHGRNGTREEFDCAVERGRVAIPVGATGGRAQDLYKELSRHGKQSAGCEILDEEWQTLGNKTLLHSDDGLERVWFSS